MRQLAAEVRIKFVEQIGPRQLALSHFIKPLFHGCGEPVVQQVTKAALQALGHNVAHFLGVKPAVLEFDVAPILNGGDDGGVGRGAANTALFQFAYEARLTVTCRRLGEMLFGIKLGHGQTVAHRERRQHGVIALARSGRLNFGKTVEFNHSALGSEAAVCGGDHQGGRKVTCGGHLTGHELAPDQVIKTLCIGLHARQQATAQRDVGRADGFVGFLSALARAVANGVGR